MNSSSSRTTTHTTSTGTSSTHYHHHPRAPSSEAVVQGGEAIPNNNNNNTQEDDDDETTKTVMMMIRPEPAGSSSGGGNPSSTTTTTTTTMTPVTLDVGRTTLFLTTSLTHLKEALDVIPLDAKKDYVEAVRCAPQLVQTESQPLKFLRCEDFNPWQAARKLVLYWEYRRWLFKDRWLLPLIDDMDKARTQDSALTEKDIHLLNAGWLAFVYAQCPEKYGRFVIVDHGRYMGHTLDTFLRVVFYLLSTASDEVAQTVGITSIRLISSTQHGGEPPFSMALFQTAKTCYKMVKDALPVRLKGAYFIKKGGNGSKGSMVNFFLNRIGGSVASLMSVDTPVTFTVPSREAAADTLGPLGFPRDVFPESHGGTWTYDRLFEWKQRVKEQQSYTTQIPTPWLSAPQPGNATSTTVVARMNDTNNNNTTISGMIMPPNGDAGNTNDRTKEVTALHARRAYRKRKQKLNETEEQAKKLRAENERLRAEHELFNSLLQQAADVVALVGTMDDDNNNGFDVVAPSESMAQDWSSF